MAGKIIQPDAYFDNSARPETGMNMPMREPQANRTTSDHRFSVGKRSLALFGRLPLARLLPQDLHSLIDYAGSAFVGACALLTPVPAAQGAALLLMAIGLIVSLLTDYRLSLVKLVPIEGHECMDYLLGAAMIAAPFALHYLATAPLVGGLHIASGVALILMATITDYRAFSR